MDAYQRFADNQSRENKECAIQCNENRLKFYSCVVEKKNELTKTTTDFSSYIKDVRAIQDECYDSNSLSNCKTIFDKIDVFYY